MAQRPAGYIVCPACKQKALPRQSHCLSCNARLPRASVAETPAGPAPIQRADGTCPGCGKGLPLKAVICIDCGFDLRTGRPIETVRVLDGEEAPGDLPRRKRKRRREPLPAGMGKVYVGLGFHYVRLVLTLLAFVVMIGLVCYLAVARPVAQDQVAIVAGLAAAGLVALAALLGVVGSFLCLWAPRDSRAWWFIFVSLLLDLLTAPLVAYVLLAALPPLIAWPVEFVSWVCFMMFLRRLAQYIDLPGEANEIMTLITRGVLLLIAVPLLLVLLGLMAFLAALASPAVVPIYLGASSLILFVQVIFIILLFFSILANIQALRSTIVGRLPRQGEEEERPETALEEE